MCCIHLRGSVPKILSEKKKNNFSCSYKKNSPHWGSGYFGYENMTLMDKVEVYMKNPLISYFHIVF